MLDDRPVGGVIISVDGEKGDLDNQFPDGMFRLKKMNGGRK